MLDIKVGDQGEIIMTGRFDASQAEKAGTFLATLTGSRNVDLGGLQYVSSAGLGVLLATQKRLMSAGHALRLVNVPRHVREVFYYSGCDRVFEIEPAPRA
jgi:anti-sigma B factor antagonist